MARDAGYEVPADLSLVGYDDIDLASLVIPALTTLAVDKTLMGRAGFGLMAHRLDVPDADRLTSVVVPRLIERESVAPPAGR
jgi:LacI family transcriptional regulator